MFTDASKEVDKHYMQSLDKMREMTDLFEDNKARFNLCLDQQAKLMNQLQKSEVLATDQISEIKSHVKDLEKLMQV